MAKAKSDVRRASSVDATKWAEGFNLDAVELIRESAQDALDKAEAGLDAAVSKYKRDVLRHMASRTAIREAVLSLFQEMLVNEQPMVCPSDTAGVIEIRIGGEDSSITPHELRWREGISDLVLEVIEREQDGQVHTLREWRKSLVESVEMLDRAIAAVGGK